jgi:hypothetical protein
MPNTSWCTCTKQPNPVWYLVLNDGCLLLLLPLHIRPQLPQLLQLPLITLGLLNQLLGLGVQGIDGGQLLKDLRAGGGEMKWGLLAVEFGVKHLGRNRRAREREGSTGVYLL